MPAAVYGMWKLCQQASNGDVVAQWGIYIFDIMMLIMMLPFVICIIREKKKAFRRIIYFLDSWLV